MRGCRAARTVGRRCASGARVNAAGIQMLSERLHAQLFPEGERPPAPECVRLARAHLAANKIPVDERRPLRPDVDVDLPPLLDLAPACGTGASAIERHFWALGDRVSAPYYGLAAAFAQRAFPKSADEIGADWVLRPGWTQYDAITGGELGPVAHPTGEVLVLDVETSPAAGPQPLIAVALSEDGLFVWLSPVVLDAACAPHASADCTNPPLVPLGDDSRPSLVIGHNVSYDRARVAEEYALARGPRRFLDTLSLHCAVAGLSSQQRTQWSAYRRARDDAPEEDDAPADAPEPWMESSAMNNLPDAMRLHLGWCVDKAPLSVLVRGDLAAIRQEVRRLVAYCANDVLGTAALFRALWPKFARKCPHPVTFAALLEMGTCFLPVTRAWPRYVDTVERMYAEAQARTKALLVDLVHETVAYGQQPLDPSERVLPDSAWSGSSGTAGLGEDAESSDSSSDDDYQSAKTAGPSPKELAPQRWMADPWLNKLDWTPVPARYTKARMKADGVTYAKGGEPRPIGDASLFGKPAWFRRLLVRGRVEVTPRTRILPYLLRMSWRGRPVHWLDAHGWCHEVRPGDAEWPRRVRAPGPVSYARVPHCDREDANVGSLMTRHHMRQYERGVLATPSGVLQAVLATNTTFSFWTGYRERIRDQLVFWLGSGARAACGASPSGVSGGGLLSDPDIGHEAGDRNVNSQSGGQPDGQLNATHIDAATADRQGNESQSANTATPSTVSIHGADTQCQSDPLVSSTDNNRSIKSACDSATTKTQLLPHQEDGDGETVGIILPALISMGTVTRRAVEPTWMTATNAKKGLAGSELKALITAPRGHVFVGADVDSQELWISSLLGDAQFGLAGATAMGWMTLQGSKADGTDLHSRTAGILGISRDDAKIFTYGRIYGAGVRYAAQLLQRFNPALGADAATERARDLYARTKGERRAVSAADTDARSVFGARPALRLYAGGTETFMFNVLELIASSDASRTPALGCEISDALLAENVADDFLTSRVNWAVQSSGVDYLHMLVAAMAHLVRRHGISARLVLTIHDEVRYLVAERDRLRAALALQVANAWTRAMFAAAAGMSDVPLGVLFFSAVDFDAVLRKEAAADCVTPSNQRPAPPGSAMDIYALVRECPSLGPVVDASADLPHVPVRPFLPFHTTYRASPALLRAQMASEASDEAPGAKDSMQKAARARHVKNAPLETWGEQATSAHVDSVFS